jgi:hypothetical protein
MIKTLSLPWAKKNTMLHQIVSLDLKNNQCIFFQLNDLENDEINKMTEYENVIFDLNIFMA